MTVIQKYNNYPPPANLRQNQDFSGENSPALSPLDAGAVNTVVRPFKEAEKESTWSNVFKNYVFPGALALGFSWLVDHSINLFCKVKPGKDYTTTGFYRVGTAVDGVVKKTVPQGAKKFFQDVKTKIGDTHSKWMKNTRYSEITECFNKCKHLDMPLAWDPSSIQHFVSPLLDKLGGLRGIEKGPELLADLGVTQEWLAKIKKELGENGHKAVNNPENREIIKQICKKIEESTEKEFKGLRLDASKIRLYEEYLAKGEASAISKILIQKSCGLGQLLGGSAGNLVMQAIFFFSAAKNIWEAPKEKKTSTFVDEMIGLVSLITLQPIIGTLVAGASGWKHLGSQVEAKLENLKHNHFMYIFNKRKVDDKTKDILKETLEGLEKDFGKKPTLEEAIKAMERKVFYAKRLSKERGEYKRALKVLNLESWKNCNFPQKITKLIGKVLGRGYEPVNRLKDVGQIYKLEGFRPAAKTVLRFLGDSPNMILRIAVLMVASSIVEKPVKALFHKILGEPYNPDEKKKEAEKKAVGKTQDKKLTMEEFLNSTKASQPQLANNVVQENKFEKYIPSSILSSNVNNKKGDGAINNKAE